jgi:Ion channel
MAETQPKLQPAALSLSAMISQYFMRRILRVFPFTQQRQNSIAIGGEETSMATRIENVWGGFGRARHLVLLISLLLLFLISPLVAAARYGTVVINSAGVIVLLSGVYAMSEQRRLFVVALIGCVAAIATNLLMVVFQSQWIAIAWHGFTLLLFGLFSVGILKDVLRRGQISTDKICGAICVYLLIGFAWAFGYGIIEFINPGSFSGLAQIGTNNHVGRIMQLRYFSVATLTTLGFGDILPRTPVARALATLEAVTGQIYLTVLIARLVGLHIVHASSRDD